MTDDMLNLNDIIRAMRAERKSMLILNRRSCDLRGRCISRVTIELCVYSFVAMVPLLTLVASLPAAAQSAVPAGPTSGLSNPICLMIEAAARTNGLPVDFFARVIWQESRFQPDVVGPLTRGGERAQGIAQFMPTTAAERRLSEPFNPVEALPKSGEFLAELRNEFGNLGLAAAAYNAGPQRVREFVAGLHDLPAETRNYVRAITGRSVDDWRQAVVIEATGERNDKVADRHAANCEDMAALAKQASVRFGTQIQERNVPSWCRSLHHPNEGVCGPVRAGGPSTVRLSRLGRSVSR